jgi:hypothetical protein
MSHGFRLWRERPAEEVRFLPLYQNYEMHFMVTQGCTIEDAARQIPDGE